VDEYLKDFPGMQDALRYVLTINAPETKDNDFTWKDFQNRINGELVDNFGNFVNRSFVLMHKLTAGKVPKLHTEILDDVDRTMLAQFSETKKKVEESLENFRFRDALFEVMRLSSDGNKYLQKKEPWIIARNLEKPENQKLIDNCLHVCLQLTANLAVLINPFLPFTAKKMQHMMKVVDKIMDWENAGSQKLLSVGYSLRTPELLFRKIENEEIENQIKKLGNKSDTNKSAEQTKKMDTTTQAQDNQKPEIVYDDFAKINLRVGTITAAEKVEKADKLLKLEIEMGSEKRTIVSGIALHYKPEEIIGKQVVVVANLAPRKMRGIESNGMILMAEDSQGKLHFVSPENKIEPGSGVS